MHEWIQENFFFSKKLRWRMLFGLSYKTRSLQMDFSYFPKLFSLQWRSKQLQVCYCFSISWSKFQGMMDSSQHKDHSSCWTVVHSMQMVSMLTGWCILRPTNLRERKFLLFFKKLQTMAFLLQELGLSAMVVLILHYSTPLVHTMNSCFEWVWTLEPLFEFIFSNFFHPKKSSDSVFVYWRDWILLSLKQETTV